MPANLSVFGEQLVGQLDVVGLGLVLRYALLVRPRVPLGLALQVQHARFACTERSISNIRFLFVGYCIALQRHSLVLLSPTLPCLNSAYASRSSWSVGRLVSAFTFSAAALKSYIQKRAHIYVYESTALLLSPKPQQRCV